MQVKPVLPPLVSRADADSRPQPDARQDEKERRQTKKTNPSTPPKVSEPTSATPAPADVTALKSEDFLELLDKTKTIAPTRNPFATEAEKTVKNLDKKL